jgi:hypothetical protein
MTHQAVAVDHHAAGPDGCLTTALSAHEAGCTKEHPSRDLLLLLLLLLPTQVVLESRPLPQPELLLNTVHTEYCRMPAPEQMVRKSPYCYTDCLR